MSFNTARSIFVQSLQSAARELKGVSEGGGVDIANEFQTVGCPRVC